LLKAIHDIETAERTSNAKKKQEKLSLLRGEVNIWRKVLKRNIKFAFSHSRRQRPVDIIVQELGDYIERNLPPSVSSLVSEPRSVIGKGVKYKFQHEDIQEIQWYFGRIVNYDCTTKFFEIDQS